MPSNKSSSFGRTVAVILAIAAAFFVLRFVASVTWNILKYGALAALLIFVVYLFMKEGDKEGDARPSERGKDPFGR
jgi:predicted membrane protein